MGVRAAMQGRAWRRARAAREVQRRVDCGWREGREEGAAGGGEGRKRGRGGEEASRGRRRAHRTEGRRGAEASGGRRRAHRTEGCAVRAETLPQARVLLARDVGDNWGNLVVAHSHLRPSGIGHVPCEL